MKSINLILGLLLLTPSIAMGGNWLSESDIVKRRAGQSTTSEEDRSKCVEPCHDVSGMDLTRKSVQDIQEDDLDQPLFGPKLDLVSALADLPACQVLAPTHCDGIDPDPGYAVRSICAVEGAGPTHELYCAAVDPQSHVQEDVRKFAPDPALIALANAATAALDATEEARVDRVARLNGAKGNIPGMTPPQRDALIQDILDHAVIQ